MGPSLQRWSSHPVDYLRDHAVTKSSTAMHDGKSKLNKVQSTLPVSNVLDDDSEYADTRAKDIATSFPNTTTAKTSYRLEKRERDFQSR